MLLCEPPALIPIRAVFSIIMLLFLVRRMCSALSRNHSTRAHAFPRRENKESDQIRYGSSDRP